jgi:hypothetical protein
MTPEERELAERLAAEAVEELKMAGVLKPAPSLLEMNFRDLAHLARQGYACGWLAQQLDHRWAPWPDLPLSTVLKTERPSKVAYLAAEMAKVGITDLLPEPPEPIPDD